jgi:hypothetical protein
MPDLSSVLSRYEQTIKSNADAGVSSKMFLSNVAAKPIPKIPMTKSDPLSSRHRTCVRPPPAPRQRSIPEHKQMSSVPTDVTILTAECTEFNMDDDGSLGEDDFGFVNDEDFFGQSSNFDDHGDSFSSFGSRSAMMNMSHYAANRRTGMTKTSTSQRSLMSQSNHSVGDNEDTFQVTYKNDDASVFSNRSKMTYANRVDANGFVVDEEESAAGKRKPRPAGPRASCGRASARRSHKIDAKARSYKKEETSDLEKSPSKSNEDKTDYVKRLVGRKDAEAADRRRSSSRGRDDEGRHRTRTDRSKRPSLRGEKDKEADVATSKVDGSKLRESKHRSLDDSKHRSLEDSKHRSSRHGYNDIEGSKHRVSRLGESSRGHRSSKPGSSHARSSVHRSSRSSKEGRPMSDIERMCMKLKKTDELIKEYDESDSYSIESESDPDELVEN